MALLAKKPEITQPPRLKSLLYAASGVGKSHLCCSIPNTYYIDTEGLEDYNHFKEMILDNNGVLVYLTELTDIINQVKDLISLKHDYKMLIIDSLSFPSGWLAQMEVERLQKKSKGDIEGTEFSAHLAKLKRLSYQLAILLTMLDMNVIVTSHEKTKYSEGKETGVIFDINEKIGYALGSIWNMRLHGKSRKLFIEKSRYPQLKKNEFIDLGSDGDNGYEVLKKIFGEEIFTRESKIIEFATQEQIDRCKYLIQILSISDEKIQTSLRKEKAPNIETLSKEAIQRWIDKMDAQFKNKAA